MDEWGGIAASPDNCRTNTDACSCTSWLQAEAAAAAAGGIGAAGKGAATAAEKQLWWWPQPHAYLSLAPALVGHHFLCRPVVHATEAVAWSNGPAYKFAAHLLYMRAFAVLPLQHGQKLPSSCAHAWALGPTQAGRDRRGLHTGQPWGQPTSDPWLRSYHCTQPISHTNRHAAHEAASSCSLPHAAPVDGVTLQPKLLLQLLNNLKSVQGRPVHLCKHQTRKQAQPHPLWKQNSKQPLHVCSGQAWPSMQARSWSRIHIRSSTVQGGRGRVLGPPAHHPPCWQRWRWGACACAPLQIACASGVLCPWHHPPAGTSAAAWLKTTL